MKDEKKLLKASKEGNIDAQFDLGSFYSLKGDLEKANYWYKKVAEQGDSEAMFMLFMNYTRDDNTPENQEQATYWLKKASEAKYFKDPDGNFTKAGKLMEDEGITELLSADLDLDKLSNIDLHRISAITGKAKSQTHLGYCYLKGDGTDINYNKAFSWFVKAATQDEPMANFCIGVMYFCAYGVSKDYKKALSAFKRSIELGIDEEPGYSGWNGIIAHTYIGQIYHFGGNGASQDDMKALTWLSQAAELEDIIAQSYLGEMYFFGDRALTTDLNKAFVWYSRAAEQGEIRAQTMLGYIYQYGHGVPKDFKEALKWSSLAAEKGSVPALKNLAVMYRYGQGVTKDEEMCFSFNLKAAKAGDVEAQVQVMGSYVHGNGVAISKKDAAYWCNLAREQGSPNAEAFWNSYELWKYK